MPASMGEGWKPEILSATRAKGSREKKKKIHKGLDKGKKKRFTKDSIEQTTQAIHDSDGGRGVSNQINELIHCESYQHFYNSSHVTISCVIQMK